MLDGVVGNVPRRAAVVVDDPLRGTPGDEELDDVPVPFVGGVVERRGAVLVAAVDEVAVGAVEDAAYLVDVAVLGGTHEVGRAVAAGAGHLNN